MKKYILKPGRHQFAPGSHAVHTNDNLSDEDAEWYLQKYPHIAGLFTLRPPKGGELNKNENEMKNKQPIIDEGVIEDHIEHLTPPSGGQGDI
jgi:hypothetical protein